MAKTHKDPFSTAWSPYFVTRRCKREQCSENAQRGTQTGFQKGSNIDE